MDNKGKECQYFILCTAGNTNFKKGGGKKLLSKNGTHYANVQLQIFILHLCMSHILN